MEKAAEIFFEHFNILPGRSAADIHRTGEVFSQIPWENLTKYLLHSSGEDRPRLADEVISGYVNNGTGGTCYSLTETLGAIMKACGLYARPLTGHINGRMNTHCALLVEGEAGRFILDPGYIVPGAVRLSGAGAGEIITAGRKMCWTPVKGGWELSTEENGRKLKRYHLESRQLSRDEFVRYWKNSFNSPGMNSLYLNRTGSSGSRISAHNGNLRIVDGMGNRNRKIRGDYPQEISEAFGVSADVARAAWEQLQHKKQGNS